MKRALTALIALGLSTTAVLAEYPEKPVEVIVGYSAGGGTDVMARTVAQFLEQELNGSVVVKNMPGAGGQIGFTEVAGANPDGYTLGTFNLPAALALTHDREADYDVTSFT
ncbi:MAG: tripartite tricarboxylate transporter substrate binding protein, partial [Marivita sp.]|uniref:Bug family tripartite tricarboxylate transporter substrate binding protein n=1 Tax=Marivita sp. TaxID=2003365 RepID=UPI0025BBDA03